MFTRLILAAAIAIALTTGANAYLVDPLHIGNWEGGAYFDDNTRRFSHCAVGTDYQNGVYLILGWGPNGLTVGFVDERWNGLAMGSQPNVRIQIDNRWDSQGQAEVVARGHLVVVMGGQPRPVTSMRRGVLLTATIGKESLSFGLTTTNAAIDALAECYRLHD